MRTASILLAFVVVLDCVGEAGANDFESIRRKYNIQLAEAEAEAPNRYREELRTESLRRHYTIRIGDYDYGFEENPSFHAVLHHSDHTLTTQGLVGFGLFVVMLIALLLETTVLWKKKKRPSTQIK